MATNAVFLNQIVEDLELEVYPGMEDFLNRAVITSEVSRTGLELTGYFNNFSPERIQLLGRTEMSFAEKMTSEERLLVFKRMTLKNVPCFIVSRGMQPLPEMVNACMEYRVPILLTKIKTNQISSLLSTYLETHLAERDSVHGVFVEVFGLGILITGASGIGKSETGLELIRNGHRLIADDRVDFYQRDEFTIYGEAPRILQNLIEIRGLGIIDVMSLFGAGSVKERTQLNLIIDLQHSDSGQEFDRLGSKDETRNILNIEIPKITIPVQTGRNVSSIIEVAAMNFRAKALGHDATKTFEENLTKLIAENQAADEKLKAAENAEQIDLEED